MPSPKGYIREEVLDRAIAAFRRQGYSGTSTAELAEALRGQLAQLKREVEANRDRLRDLAAAAQDGPAMERLCEAAAARGLRPEAPELLRHDAQRLMGWWLELRR